MTIVVTQTVLYCSSISAMKTSEFEIILTFKVVDLRVFFNLQLDLAHPDIRLNNYGQITKLTQN